MMSSTKNSSKKRQLSLFPGKCEVCGVPEDKFVCCENCIEEWESKFLKQADKNSASHNS